MARETVQGLAEANAVLQAIPIAAREQVAVETAIIGREVLAAMKRDVPRDTGALAGALMVQTIFDQLRTRVGLLGISKFRPKLFYGIIVEYGRKAQVVRLTRGKRAKQLRAIGESRTMKVSALPARPFVHADRPEIRAEQRLANFWSEVMAKAGSAA